MLGSGLHRVFIDRDRFNRCVLVALLFKMPGMDADVCRFVARKTALVEGIQSGRWSRLFRHHSDTDVRPPIPDVLSVSIEIGPEDPESRLVLKKTLLARITTIEPALAAVP
jgi:hypothetical protein